MSTDLYAERPWLARYAEGQPSDITPEFTDALAMFRASVDRAPDRTLIAYFDAHLSVREVDEITDALAVGLREGGLADGDRVALYLQNVPQFLLALIGTWKAGGVAVAVNPMNRETELTYLLKDSGAKVLVCLESLYAAVASKVVGDTDVERVLVTSELKYQTRNDPRVFAKIARVETQGTEDLEDVIEAHRGQKPDPASFDKQDVAVLTYTSGTTGVPKGAMNTHGNVTFNAQVYRDWVSLTGDDVILAVAPLFHITGLIAHVAIALLLPAPCVLTYRFEPDVVAETVEAEGCTFSVGAITVFIALMNTESVTTEQMATLKTILSGGAPIPPAVLKAFEARFGVYIYNVYGLTETTSPSHGVPIGAIAPVDEASGATSVGVPVFNTIVRILDEDGNPVAPGEIGEFQTEGPQVVKGYWNKPEATATGLPGGRLNTGDVGFMDENGFYYIVDRKKDMINAAGYKVWPREVEDFLYGHPAVREAAVVGVPDDYRGESVKAYVSLKPGTTATPEEIIAFCKERMAAYKYPRQVEIIDEVPKTVTGKVLRRELRALNT